MSLPLLLKDVHPGVAPSWCGAALQAARARIIGSRRAGIRMPP